MFFILFCNQDWNWSADYCRQTAYQLARHGPVCCYAEHNPVGLFQLVRKKRLNMERISDRLYLYHPLAVVPLRRNRLMRRMNDWVNICLLQIFSYFYLKSWGHNKILWHFDGALSHMTSSVFGSAVSIYDCVDDVWDSHDSGSSLLRLQEAQLLSKVRRMFVNSRTLLRKYKKKGIRPVLVPLGFRAPQAQNRLIKSALPKKRVVIGFVGVIDYRMDFDLIERLARRNPSYTFVLQGEIHPEYHRAFAVQSKIDRLRVLRNVVLRDPIAPEHIYQAISGFDICMIPYRDDIDITVHSFPMKIFEYFYMGKPVISGPIRELERFPKYIKIAASMVEWESHIKALRRSNWPVASQRKQRELALQNTWSKKIDRIVQVLSAG